MDFMYDRRTYRHVPDLWRPIDGACHHLIAVRREEEVVHVDLLGSHQTRRVPTDVTTVVQLVWNLVNQTPIRTVVQLVWNLIV